MEDKADMRSLSRQEDRHGPGGRGLFVSRKDIPSFVFFYPGFALCGGVTTTTPDSVTVNCCRSCSMS